MMAKSATMAMLEEGARQYKFLADHSREFGELSSSVAEHKLVGAGFDLYVELVKNYSSRGDEQSLNLIKLFVELIKK